MRPDALSCKAILRAAGLEHWLVGKTKIFLKYHHVEKLATILEKYRYSVILVQRGWLFLCRLDKYFNFVHVCPDKLTQSRRFSCLKFRLSLPEQL